MWSNWAVRPCRANVRTLLPNFQRAIWRKMKTERLHENACIFWLRKCCSAPFGLFLELSFAYQVSFSNLYQIKTRLKSRLLLDIEKKVGENPLGSSSQQPLTRIVLLLLRLREKVSILPFPKPLSIPSKAKSKKSGARNFMATTLWFFLRSWSWKKERPLFKTSGNLA